MWKILFLILKLFCGKKLEVILTVILGTLLIYFISGNILYKRNEITSTKFYSLAVSLKPNARYTCVVLNIYGGDTFKCRLDGGKEIKVRLIGVDTSESSKNTKAYKDIEGSRREIEKIVQMEKGAKEFVKGILKRGMEVVLETDVLPMDKYGRVLAYVYLPNGKMLNLLLIKEGYAAIYTLPPNVKYAREFKKAQEFAIKKRKGLWSQRLGVK